MTDALITAVRFEDAHGRRVVHATFDDGRSDELFAFFADEILFCEGDHGNSRLMSAGVRMPGVAGRSARRGAHNR
jgi:hypothetical protein